MIHYRLDAVNGGKKPKLSQMSKRQNAAHEDGDARDANIARAARLMAEDDQREANEIAKTKEGIFLVKLEALHKELETEKARYKAMEAQRHSEAELFNQMKGQMIVQLHEANEALGKLVKEIDVLKSREQLTKDDADMSVSLQRTLVKDMETKLSQTFGKLAQSEKQNRALMEAAQQKPQAMTGAAHIPSFEFTPVKDRDGKIVKLIANPIGD